MQFLFVSFLWTFYEIFMNFLGNFLWTFLGNFLWPFLWTFLCTFLWTFIFELFLWPLVLNFFGEHLFESFLRMFIVWFFLECDVFIECTTVLEDLLTTKTKSMLDLKRIPILKSVVQSCSDSQFPFLCRVIAVIMSDNDNTKPANDTLKGFFHKKIKFRKTISFNFNFKYENVQLTMSGYWIQQIMQLAIQIKNIWLACQTLSSG